jgi:hypothetical protein
MKLHMENINIHPELRMEVEVEIPTEPATRPLFLPRQPKRPWDGQ